MTAFSSTLQKCAILALTFCPSGAVGAAEQDVGLDADPAQLLDAVLGRLGLQLAGGGDERHQGEVDVEHVARGRRPCGIWRMASRNGRLSMSPTVPPTSTIDDVEAFGGLADALLDLVGDVRNDLDGPAEILAAALLADHVS